MAARQAAAEARREREGESISVDRLLGIDVEGELGEEEEEEDEGRHTAHERGDDGGAVGTEVSGNPTGVRPHSYIAGSEGASSSTDIPLQTCESIEIDYDDLCDTSNPCNGDAKLVLMANKFDVHPRIIDSEGRFNVTQMSGSEVGRYSQKYFERNFSFDFFVERL